MNSNKVVRYYAPTGSLGELEQATLATRPEIIPAVALAVAGIVGAALVGVWLIIGRKQDLTV